MTNLTPINGTGTLTANGILVYTLVNNGGNARNIYTVHVVGTWGSGTVTAFTNPISSQDTASNSPAYDAAILDSAGDPVSITSNSSFNFECNSDLSQPAFLKLKLASATNPSLKFVVSKVS